jgi:hypothetical protein
MTDAEEKARRAGMILRLYGSVMFVDGEPQPPLAIEHKVYNRGQPSGLVAVLRAHRRNRRKP